MSKIKYIVGDATNPHKFGYIVIAHVCNNSNRWGAGFVLALSRKWKEPEAMYRSLNEYNLGDVQYVHVEEGITVINMIAQHGTGKDSEGKSPIRYQALREALRKVNSHLKVYNGTLHIPRIDAGLAGGDWNVITRILNEEIEADIYAYDLQPMPNIEYFTQIVQN